MLKKENGNVVISMVIVVMAVVSGLVFSSIASRDATATLLSLDSTQELHWLRSEVSRGVRTNQEYTGSTDQYLLPIKKVQVSHGYSETTYAMKTQLSKYVTSSGMNVSNKRLIRTKVKGFRTSPSHTNYYGTTNKSPIEKYGERLLQQETFAGYMYLTNTDESVNGDPVYFYGRDELWGRVHSNTDIWIEQVSGWPLFHDHVSTAGHIQSEGNPPEDEVFLDGYTEEAAWIEFNPSADLIRRNGLKPFGDAESDSHEIVYVRIDGMAYNVMYGDIHVREYPVQPETLYVYDAYPPMDDVGDSIGYNVITFVDTTWSHGNAGTVPSGNSVFCFDTLWLKGTISGAQTWGCAKDIYLVDDIIYDDTFPGEAPDGYDDDPVNQSDYLGIVSERRIFIQYGLRDVMADSLRHHYNCDDIYIYAALCALGEADDPHEDGQFTFEYQYPHYSSPSTWYMGELFTYPDLHLCWYPPNNPPYWPAPVNQAIYASQTGDAMAPDYPWYNPLWPERTPIRLRGTIYLFGALSQNRRGHVRRSGSDHLDTADHWDLDNYIYGVNAYGRETINSSSIGVGATGYDKAYHYDHRFIDNPPPDFPEVSIRGKGGQFRHITMKIKRPPTNF